MSTHEQPSTTSEPAARSGPTPISEVALRVVRGNWLGAGLVALATAFTAGLLGLVLALLAKPVDFGVSNTLALATVIAVGAFGADLQLGLASSGDDSFFDVSGDASIGVFPLTVTIVACVVGVLVFLRVTRGYPALGAVLGDATRAALLFGLFLAVPALVFTADNDELGRGWGQQASADALGYRADASASALGAFGLGFLVLVVVLCLAGLSRASRAADARRAAEPVESTANPGTTVQARLARVGEVARPVLGGVTTLVLALPVAGVLGLLALVLGEDTGEQVTGEGLRATIAFIAGGLANGGMWLLSLGSAAPVGGRGEATGDSPSSDYSRLWGEVTDSEPGLWIAPLVLVGVLVLATWVVLRRARREDGLVALGAWLVSLLVVVPLLVRLSSIHASAVLESGVGGESQRFTLSGVAGPEGVQTTLLVLVVASLVALAFAWRGGLLDQQRLRDLAGRAGSAVQRNPARP